jgi:uncharacterized cupredoxin-like copper-binding protein
MGTDQVLAVFAFGPVVAPRPPAPPDCGHAQPRLRRSNTVEHFGRTTTQQPTTKEATTMRRLFVTGLLTLGFMSPGAYAHSESHTAKPKKAGSTAKGSDFGRPGDPKQVTRTIRIDMDDTMHYSVDQITVRRGETIRFVAYNAGKVLHEIVLGTPQEIAEHAELMRKFPDMEHDEEYQLHVKPGTTGEMVWQFTISGEFKFACLMPGHYEAGMVGKVVVLNEEGNATQKVSRRDGAGGTGS